MTARGWSDAGLKTVGDDPSLWTAADAARLLGPPELTVTQVRHLVRLMSLKPVGRRRTGNGRHSRVFRAVDFIRGYEILYRAGKGDTAAP